MRTFIAIELPESVKESLSSLVKEMGQQSEGIKWIKKQGMHITLKFLGEITKDQSDLIQRSLMKIAEALSPFSLKVQGTGRFPENRPIPRVIWAGINESPDLIRLQKRIEDEMSLLGFPKEDRPFHPHLTLGRVKKAHGMSKVTAILERENQTVFGHFEAQGITFFQSILKPTGAEYHSIKEVKFI